MLNRLEDAFINDIDRVSQESALTSAEEKVLSILKDASEKVRPRMEDFKESYESREIQKDASELIRMKNREVEKTKWGELLEHIVVNFGERAGWFGKNCEVRILSEFDDRKTHSDALLEITKDGKVIRLLIDITSSQDNANIQKKLGYSIDQNRNPELYTVKYFDSKNNLDSKKGVENVPRVVVGFSPVTIRLLCQRIIESTKEISKTLSSAPEQLLLWEEVIVQLVSLKHSANIKSSDPKKEAMLSSLLEYAQQTAQEKESLRSSVAEAKLNADLVFRQLTR